MGYRKGVGFFTVVLRPEPHNNESHVEEEFSKRNIHPDDVINIIVDNGFLHVTYRKNLETGKR